jgi:parallel beta-helix repeat protein
MPSTLTVLDTLDSGTGSLRAEIAAAQNNDTIVFASGLNGTITLTSGQLLITQSLTIVGPGPGDLTISGNSASRVFAVAGSNGIKVTLSGLKIMNGVAQDGGAIENFGNLTVSNCTLSNNVAKPTGTFPEGSGGAIFNSGPGLTVSGCTLSDNLAAADGGAIFARDPTTVVGCIIKDNTADQEGGGIWDGLGLTLDDCTVSGNTATSAGGGIYIGPSGNVTVENSSTIIGNTAPPGSGPDVYNAHVLYWDGTGTLGTDGGNPSMPKKH